MKNDRIISRNNNNNEIVGLVLALKGPQSRYRLLVGSGNTFMQSKSSAKETHKNRKSEAKV